ncbi:hypothetical protein F5Y06DRAFT_19177 [Hypoxylon sp. FL0890]|nr:hypothetical protein F5Y06DRAFT_19177 [Hypoxylon sp. FL0890]
MSHTTTSVLVYTEDVVIILFAVLVHFICITGLFLSSYISRIGELLGMTSFIIIVCTGFWLSISLGPRSGRPSTLCRPLCGFLAVALFWTWVAAGLIFGTGNFFLGEALAWGIICYWLGFALEWKQGYCYSFVEVATRVLAADYLQESL